MQRLIRVVRLFESTSSTSRHIVRLEGSSHSKAPRSLESKDLRHRKILRLAGLLESNVP